MASAAPFSAIFRRSYDALRANRRLYLTSALLFLIISFVLQFAQGLTGGAAENEAAGPLAFSLLLSLISGIVGYLIRTFYLVLAVDRPKRMGEGFERVWGLFFPLIGLSIWTFIRTYVWIPGIAAIIVLVTSDPEAGLNPFLILFLLVAVALGIVLGPRFAFGGVILAAEGKKIRESVELSYVRTRGYWGKVIGNTLLLGLCGLAMILLLVVCVAVLAVVGYLLREAVPQMLLIILGAVLIVPLFFVFLMAVQLWQGFTQIFQVELHHEIKAHPRKA